MRIRRLFNPCLVAVAVLVASGAPAAAQNGGMPAPAATPDGRVVGRVVDAATGAGLSNVVVSVLGTDAGALSGMDGKFVISNVPAGKVTLRAENIGYAAKQVSDVTVPSGGVTEQNITLAPQAVQLTAINVTAAAERGSVNRALDAQRTAAAIVSAVTAEQISRSPDGDAAAAMQRVSGVTVQEGKFVLVRGLGERYTTTSLNGARIPSPEPERKLVPLDLFPAGLLQTITTAKTFTPDLAADFSGAQVDIQTREFPAGRQVTYSMGVGYNTRTTGQEILSAPTEGMEWLGFAGEARRVPALLDAAGNFQQGVTPSEMNEMVRQIRNVWTPETSTGRPNGSLGLSAGGTDPIFGQPISYLLSGTYSFGQETQAEQRRAYALPGGEPGATVETDRFTGSTGRTSVLWGGLLNASSLVGEHSRFLVNVTYNRTAENEGRLERGLSENHGQLPLTIQRLKFIERAVYSGQVKGEHQFATGQRLDWTATTSGVNRNEPDRAEFVYAQFDPAAPPTWFSATEGGAVRTFAALSERSNEFSTNYRVAFGDPGRSHAIKLGVLFRATDRDAASDAWNFSTSRLTASELARPAEEVFGSHTGAGSEVFTIRPLSQGGSYTAKDRLAAGYAMAELALSDRFQVVTGARVERSNVEVSAQPTIGDLYTTSPRYTDLLPAAALNVKLREDQTLRLSAAQTLARPEYRELAEIQYREVLGGDNVVGNPDLERTLIQNYDVRWEWYPNLGEAISIALFAKRFDKPIERIYLGTSGTRLVSFVNAERADNYGAELELRKRLLEPLTVFTNLTLMNSRIVLPADAAGQTNTDRAMVGQAPYVINAGATYATEAGSTSATVLYNVVGRKIYSASEAPLPEVYEEARHSLDVSLRLALTASFSAKLDAKNLLDPAYELTQGRVTREYYRSGRSLSLGVAWKR